MNTSATGTGSVEVGQLYQSYTPPPGACDEVFEQPGIARGHYDQLTTALQELGVEELARRAEQAQRMIRDNGTTYNAYGDAASTARPWNLDPTPLVFSSTEWRKVSLALEQRARLLNAVLVDLYGPQRLLQRGLLPPELVFSHPAFLRQFHGLRIPNDSFLHLYAADLTRAADGQWWVVADRTDAPQGAGYTLENRIVVSRLLPGVMHECRVERLASFFIAMQDALRSRAPHRENPRVVLLSQGPTSPSYFEDAYLARYLGYTLVETGDLTVRSDSVLLKTLGGLLRVDVVLRRISDLYTDPLELRGPAELGIAGLVEAVRAGNVAIANGLGSSLVESPAFLPFLPLLCREMLSEELLLPSVASWWCGQPEACQYVLEHLDQLTIQAAFRVGRMPQKATDELARLSRDELMAAIRAAPHLYSAQERIEHSTCPVFTSSGWRASRVALRTYVTMGGGKVTVMPGGLLRVSSQSAPLHWSVLAGEGSKDAWVLADGPVREVTLLQSAGKRLELRRSGAELPSRVADNLFWLGRYVERADSNARLLRSTVVRLASETGAGNQPELVALLRCLAAQGQIEPGFVVEGIRDQLPEIEEMVPQAALDTRQGASLASTLVAVHRLASLVRDRLSIDSWRILLGIHNDLQSLLSHSRVDLPDLLDFLNRLVIDLAAFSGLVAESTTRTQGWRFLEMGRRIERSLQTIEVIRNTLLGGNSVDAAVLEAVLEVADSMMTYRSRYLANLQMAPTLDLLLTDETNPRSLAYQLVAIASHVENLPRDHTQPLRGPEQRIAISALSAIRLVDMEFLTEKVRSGERSKLERLLERLQEQLPKLSDLVSHKYLVHAASPRQLADSRRGTQP